MNGRRMVESRDPIMGEVPPTPSHRHRPPSHESPYANDAKVATLPAETQPLPVATVMHRPSTDVSLRSFEWSDTGKMPARLREQVNRIEIGAQRANIERRSFLARVGLPRGLRRVR